MGDYFYFLKSQFSPQKQTQNTEPKWGENIAFNDWAEKR